MKSGDQDKTISALVKLGISHHEAERILSDFADVERTVRISVEWDEWRRPYLAISNVDDRKIRAQIGINKSVRDWLIDEFPNMVLEEDAALWK